MPKTDFKDFFSFFIPSTNVQSVNPVKGIIASFPTAGDALQRAKAVGLKRLSIVLARCYSDAEFSFLTQLVDSRARNI